MKATIHYNGKNYNIDFSEPKDISIPIRGQEPNVNAWGVGHPKIAPHVEGNFIGSVSGGGAVNFNDISFNPHAHGTHTEGVGHITEEFYSINQSLNQFFFLTKVISVVPELQQDDWVISEHILKVALKEEEIAALVIRTKPNDRAKLTKHYTDTNPPYFTERAMKYLVDRGVKHLLVDLPSVDKEKDDGALAAHKIFWSFDGQLRKEATITELIYVPEAIEDGYYLLNLQMASFENDASPSRPVLFEIEKP